MQGAQPNPKAVDVGQILLIVLQHQQHNALHDAANFSRLLCVSRALRNSLLDAAVGRLVLSLPSQAAGWSSSRSLTLWLQQHMRLCKKVQLLPDLLAQPIDSCKAVIEGAWQLPGDRRGVCSRLACLLADAVGTGASNKLPVLTGWYGHELPTATLSLLPGGHLTQLVLAGPHYYKSTLDELAALTNLRELWLPACPDPVQLVTALSGLTRLTQLFLVVSPEVESDLLPGLPVSLQQLVLACGNDDEDGVLSHGIEFSLDHLTNLHTLHIGGLETVSHRVLVAFGLQEHTAVGGYLCSEVTLPSSLQRLAVQGLDSIAPLRPLRQLAHLQLVCNYPMSLIGDVLPQLTSVTSLTRVELLQPPGVSIYLEHVGVWSRRLAKLPLYVPSLEVQVPSAACDEGVDTDVRPVGFGALATGALTGLTSLHLARRKARRAAAILTAAAAAGGNGVGPGAWCGNVQDLAGALARLTNLAELQLRQVPAVAAHASVEAMGPDWLPVMQAIAGLPQLRDLRIEVMPVGISVSALSAASCLTSLALVSCKVDNSTALALVNSMCCATCLQQLVIAPEMLVRRAYVGPMPAEGHFGDAVLLAVAQRLQDLRSLRLQPSLCSEAALIELRSRCRRLELLDVVAFHRFDAQ